MSIFEFSDYKDFVSATVRERGTVKGYKTLVAQAAGCQVSYLSQVLHGDAHFTADHILGVADFWGLNDEEKEFLLFLNLRQRSARHTSSKFLSKQLELRKIKSKDFAARAKRSEAQKEDISTYYTSPLLAATHMFASISGLDDVNALSKRLDLTPFTLAPFLQTLHSLGFIEMDGTKINDLQKGIHLSKESPLATLHHLNFRNYGMRRLSERRQEGFHFTSVYSASNERFRIMKAALRDFLINEDQKNIAAPSEDVFVLNVDLFPF